MVQETLARLNDRNISNDIRDNTVSGLTKGTAKGIIREEDERSANVMGTHGVLGHDR